jgi:hypothetical protein
LRKGYGKIVQVWRPNKSEKNWRKGVAEGVSEWKKAVSLPKKALNEKRIVLPAML